MTFKRKSSYFLWNEHSKTVKLLKEFSLTNKTAITTKIMAGTAFRGRPPTLSWVKIKPAPTHNLFDVAGMQIQSATYLSCRIMMLHLVYFLFPYKGYMKYLEMFIYFAKLAFPSKGVFHLLCQYKHIRGLTGGSFVVSGFTGKQSFPSVLVP